MGEIEPIMADRLQQNLAFMGSFQGYIWFCWGLVRLLYLNAYLKWSDMTEFDRFYSL